MDHDRDAIDAGYRYCRRMSRRAGSNFHAGFMLLPAEKRRAMWALYAFMRHTDDLADAPTAGRSPRDALTEWRAALEHVLNAPRRENDDCRMMNDELRLRPPGIQNSSFIIHHSSLLPALADAVRRFHIPPEHLFAVIDGVEMDLDGRRYETFNDLRQYCERVASAVGLACIHVWGFRGPEAFGPARAAGVALQLTNILRDLREDAAAGRLYLPLADLRDCGYSIEDLRSGVINGPFRRLMKLEIGRAVEQYRAAEALAGLLRPHGRRIFGITMETYRALLKMIAEEPEMVLQRRVRLGRWNKLSLIARWTLFPPRKIDLQ